MYRTRTLPMAWRLAAVGAAALLAMLLASRQAAAQRIGLEAGLAGVENYRELTPSLGVSAFLPLTERFRVGATASQWIGCDQNSRTAGGCPELRSGYGNRGVNVLGLYEFFRSQSLAAALGAGMGWYEMRRVRNGESVRSFTDAFTFSGELRHPVAYNSAVYLRGDLSFPTDDVAPRWSFLRLGVDVGGL